mmetsp:Transcript_2917/g.7621  ORF Transcript_2917/g.7621 Transcript_2917/m.7621 type:complete len:329 (+) Transcript_2917:85-1071(+)
MNIFFVSPVSLGISSPAHLRSRFPCPRTLQRNRTAHYPPRCASTRPPPPPDLLSTLPLASVRADRFLAATGLAPSRASAAKFLTTHDVRIAGTERVTRVAQKLRVPIDTDALLVDGCPGPSLRARHLALYKPTGFVCSHDDPNVDSSKLITALLPETNPPLLAVGRLDRMASGLLILTQSGSLVHALTHPRRHLPKRYLVSLDEPRPMEWWDDAIGRFERGEVVLHGEPRACKPAKLEPIRYGDDEETCDAYVTLTEGKYHQLRRMFASIGSSVVGIHRISLGPLGLENLRICEGKWVDLTDEQVLDLWYESRNNQAANGELAGPTSD